MNVSFERTFARSSNVTVLVDVAFRDFQCRASQQLSKFKVDSKSQSDLLVMQVDGIHAQVSIIKKQQETLHLKYVSLEWKMKIIQQMHLEEIQRFKDISFAERSAWKESEKSLKEMIKGMIQEHDTLAEQLEHVIQESQDHFQARAELQSWCKSLHEENKHLALQLQMQKSLQQKRWSDFEMLLYSSEALLTEFREELRRLDHVLRQMISPPAFSLNKSSDTAMWEEDPSFLPNDLYAYS